MSGALEFRERNALITGGAGFFGDVLKRRLLDEGIRCVSVDLNPDPTTHPSLTSVTGDIRDRNLMEPLFREESFFAVFHCAAILAHAVRDKKFLWSCNTVGTKVIAELAVAHKVSKLVFTSSNCLWGSNMGRSVTEDDVPRPIEVYGRSKLEAEGILRTVDNQLDVTILRCPTIVSEGRLGLLGILFEFIHEGRNVWVVGDGSNRYQFIYAPDLANACVKAIRHKGSNVFNVGSDNVKSLRETFEYVIERAQSDSRVSSLPKRMTLAALKAANVLKISPLGPYQIGMIAEDFAFDTSKIKRFLNWQPTLTNEEMLSQAYEHYTANLAEINARQHASAHRSVARMGVIRIVKWLS